MTKKKKDIMTIPYDAYVIEVEKTVFSFFQARIRKGKKVVWNSPIEKEFVNWDQAALYAKGVIDNGEIK